jgi:hypothetical protein
MRSVLDIHLFLDQGHTIATFVAIFFIQVLVSIGFAIERISTFKHVHDHHIFARPSTLLPRLLETRSAEGPSSTLVGHLDLLLDLFCFLFFEIAQT